jgi:RNA polymerase sigma factor (sigma-70 family)
MEAQTAARNRPSRAEIEPAALDLIQRHGEQIMSTARRYSATAEDAEDAYQRGLEILLTKAPSTSEDDLVPWLKTVVKHEAFAVRKQRTRTPPVSSLLDDHEEPAEPLAPGTTDEEAERYERLRLGAEAMGRLKPQEIRALLLKAEGLTYREIQDETGWTYTKVNRCITEGRRSFLERVRGIESGAECERLAPLLSALADGEATAADMAALRPHLRSCLACRATLRDYREAPARVAAFAPLVVAPQVLARGLHKLHEVLAHLGAAKTAAVIAVAASVAGGTLGAVHTIHHGHHRPPPPKHHTHTRSRPRPVAHIARVQARPLVAHPQRRRHHKAKPKPHAVATPRTPATPEPVAAPSALRAPPPPLPSNEFGP